MILPTGFPRRRVFRPIIASLNIGPLVIARANQGEHVSAPPGYLKGIPDKSESGQSVLAALQCDELDLPYRPSIIGELTGVEQARRHEYFA